MINHPEESPSPAHASLGFASMVDEAPRDLLDRIVQGDPLKLRRLVHQRMAERALLWDEEALCLRAFALCAYQTVAKRRRRLDRDWLIGLIDRAIEQLALAGEPLADDGQVSAFELFGLPLDFAPGDVAKACLALNRMDEEQRRCFRLLLIDGRDLDDVARELGRDGGTVGRAAREALDQFFGSLVPPNAHRSDH